MMIDDDDDEDDDDDDCSQRGRDALNGTGRPIIKGGFGRGGHVICLCPLSSLVVVGELRPSRHPLPSALMEI